MNRILSTAISLCLAAQVGSSITLDDIQRQPASRKAQTISEERGIVALDQTLRELTNPYTVMWIGLRPGGEDAAALVYYHRNLGARTIAMYALNQPGVPCGTPEMSRPRGPEAAVRQSLVAATVEGADVYHLNLKDPGSDASAEETIALWGKDGARDRLVMAIRQVKPDVILTDDPATQDVPGKIFVTLVGSAINEAGARKPEDDTGTDVWPTRRWYQRTGEKSPETASALAALDPVRGMPYEEMARTALSLYRPTQPTADIGCVYRLVHSLGDAPAPRFDLFLNGLSLPRNLARSLLPPIPGGADLLEAIGRKDLLIKSLLEKLSEKRAEGSPGELKNRYGTEFFRVVRYTEALERALALAMNLDFRCELSDPAPAVGQTLIARLRFVNGGSQALPLGFLFQRSLKPVTDGNPFKSSEPYAAAPGQSVSRAIDYSITADLPAVDTSHTAPEYFPVASDPGSQVAGQPFGNQIIAIAEVQVDNMTIRIPASVRFQIRPQVEISITPPVALVSALRSDSTAQREVNFTARLINRTPGELAGAFWIVPLALENESYEPVHIKFSAKDDVVILPFRLKLPIQRPPLATDVIVEFRLERPAPPEPLGKTKIEVKAVDLIVSAEDHQVAYLADGPSVLPMALAELGIHAEQLTDALAGNDSRMAQFDAIVLDDYVLGGRKDSAWLTGRLMAYVQGGGTVLMLEQSPDDVNRLGALPLKLSKDAAPWASGSVAIVGADDIVFSRPNVIRERDFAGWGRSCPVHIPDMSAAANGPAVLAGNPLELPLKPLLSCGRIGNGRLVYCAMPMESALASWNAGALRLLANIIGFRSASRPLVEIGPN